MNLKQYRDDVVCYPVPFDKITASVCAEAKLRKLVRTCLRRRGRLPDFS